MRVRLSSIVLCCMCLLLIGTPYIAQRTNNIIKLALETALAAIVIMVIQIPGKSIKKIIPILIYFGLMIISTYMAHGIGSRTINALITGGVYILFFLLINVLSEKNSCEYVVRIVRNNLLFYMIIFDFFVIVTMGKGLGGDLEEAVYLLGNKFTLSYLHMAVLALINFENKKVPQHKDVVRCILFFLYSIMILYIADVITGMIGCIFVFLFLLVFQHREKMVDLLSKPVMPVIFFLVINVIFLLTDTILNNDFFVEFFLSRSHTETILSGRVVMYEIAMKAITQNPLWGYGLNYDIVKTTLSFGNAQNGLLKSLLDFGIVGTVAFIYVLYMTFKNAENDNSLLKIDCMAFVYGMLLCSLVEINLAAIFMLICACINAMGNGAIRKQKID